MMSSNDERMACVGILSHENNKRSRTSDKEFGNEMGHNKGKLKPVHHTIEFPRRHTEADVGCR